MSPFVATITSSEPALRNRSLESLTAGLPVEQLRTECVALDKFRRTSDNLYERVRALFFLYAIHRFHLPARLREARDGKLLPPRIPFSGYEHLLHRRFEEAIDHFLAVQQAEG